MFLKAVSHEDAGFLLRLVQFTKSPGSLIQTRLRGPGKCLPLSCNWGKEGCSTVKRITFPLWARVMLWSLILLYVLLFGLISVQRHRAFLTTAFDLGNFDQAIWNTLHGQPFRLTNIEGVETHLAIHVSPILLAIAPLYLLWSDPSLLLWLQSILLGLGAYPLFRLVHRRAFPEWGEPWASLVGLGFAVVYFLFPALESANLFDFHTATLASPLLLFAFYALEEERWGRFTLFTLLAMACKEDIPLLVGMLGLYLLLRKRWRIGAPVLAVSALWFFLATGVILPAFDRSGVSPIASRYHHLGRDAGEILGSLLRHPGQALSALASPENLTYVRNLLTPVVFLPLAAPEVFLLGAPTLAVNLLSADLFMHQLEGFHYAVALVPFVVLSGAVGLLRLAREVKRRLPRAGHWVLALGMLMVLSSSLAYHRAHGYSPLALGFHWPKLTTHHRLGEQMARRIPPQAVVSALPRLNPHVTQRRTVYSLDRFEEGHLARIGDAEYVWVDVTNFWPLHPNDLKAGIETLLKGDFGIETAEDGWLLLRRGAPVKVFPEAFFSFVRPRSGEPAYPVEVDFTPPGQDAPALRLVEFSISVEPRINRLLSPRFPFSASLTYMTKVRLCWQALAPLPQNLRLYPFFYDDSTGQILEDTTLRPMVEAIWYPPYRWQRGETVCTETIPWDVGEDFAVGLGVMESENWQEEEGRWRAKVNRSPIILRLFEDNTWVRLIGVRGGKPQEERRSFSPPSLAHPVNLRLGEEILLLGYDVTPPLRSALHRGESIRLTLYWQALKPMEESYTVFVHLYDAKGTLIAQEDSIPCKGNYPTIWWLPGEVVSDTYLLTIPEVYEAGEALLAAGMYVPDSGERLPVSNSEGKVLGDKAELGVFSLRPIACLNGQGLCAIIYEGGKLF